MKRLTKKDWDDVADLLDDCVAHVELLDNAGHTKESREWVVNKLKKECMEATKKSHDMKA